MRHRHNFKKSWPGEFFKNALWEAARASTLTEFKRCMEGIKLISQEAHDYLFNANPQLWSRHVFSPLVKCDILLNNVCESFNKYILEARDKPICTVLEMIWRKLMERFVTKREGMQTYPGNITPRSLKRLQFSMDEAVNAQAHWAGGSSFEVDHKSKTFVVDLNGRSYTCNKLDLSRIPYPHAVSCIMYRGLDVHDFVHPCYSKEAMLKAYDHTIQLMPGMSE